MTRFGWVAPPIGYTIYPGSGLRNQMFQDLRDLINEARAVGLPTIVWSYPRGSGLSKEGETAVDVVAYAAQIACQLGAHVVKVKPPNRSRLPGRGQEELRERSHRDVGRAHSACRAGGVQREAHRHLLRWRGQGHRGRSRRRSAEIAKGGAYGSIVGRNAFQRSNADAVKLLHDIMDLYAAQA